MLNLFRRLLFWDFSQPSRVCSTVWRIIIIFACFLSIFGEGRSLFDSTCSNLLLLLLPWWWRLFINEPRVDPESSRFDLCGHSSLQHHQMFNGQRRKDFPRLQGNQKVANWQLTNRLVLVNEAKFYVDENISLQQGKTPVISKRMKRKKFDWEAGFITSRIVFYSDIFKNMNCDRQQNRMWKKATGWEECFNERLRSACK